MGKNIYGLSMQEVEEKRRKGEGEHEPESITKKEINLTEVEEKQLVRAYLDASDDNNATFQALQKLFADNNAEEKIADIKRNITVRQIKPTL